MTMPLKKENNGARTMHVLLIEDDAEDRKLVSDYLVEAGPGIFSLEFADRLSVGLRTLSEKVVDAVLLDLFLPDSEGLETFTQVHSRFPRVPIVILTGLDDEELAMRAVRRGAQDYLRKEQLTSELLIRALRYAAERKQAEEQIRRAQMIEAISRMVGGVAHDFNNLLEVILEHCAILHDCALRGEVPARAVERIERAARSAASLTAQLQAFSQRQTLRPLLLDPNEAVRQARQLLRHIIHENIALVVRTDAEVGRVRIDPVQFQQILLNLAMNAGDAMLPGGTVTIETGNVDLREGDSVGDSPVQPGPYVTLAVSDTGIGVDAWTRVQVSEPFYAIEPTRAQVGLANVYDIVRQCGGHISVDSEPETGTTVRVFLPRAESHAESHGLADLEGEPPRCAETILVVEDNVGLRDVYCGFLVGAGYTVLEAGSAEHALTVAHGYSGPIHLLLTNLILPSGGGEELASQLTSQRPEMRVIYVSGYADEVVAQPDLLNSSIVVLQKPFSKNQLIGFVREALDVSKSKGVHVFV